MKKKKISVLSIKTNESYFLDQQNQRFSITEFVLIIVDEDRQWHAYNKEKRPQDNIYIIYDEGKSKGIVKDETGKTKLVKNLLCIWRFQFELGLNGILLQRSEKDELICMTWDLFCSKKKTEKQWIKAIGKMFSYINTERIQSMEEALLIEDGENGKKEDTESI